MKIKGIRRFQEEKPRGLLIFRSGILQYNDNTILDCGTTTYIYDLIYPLAYFNIGELDLDGGKTIVAYKHSK